MTEFGKHVCQHLADLSGKPVQNLKMDKLAKMYGKAVELRKEAEYQKSREDRYNMPQVEYLKKLVAREIEKCAEETDSSLPLISVFDALQIVKAHKDRDEDLGLRTLIGHLERLWKKDREASITAGSYLALKEYYTRQYPKSRVASVFESFQKQGYMDLPVGELMNIVAQIETQADYDYLIRDYGLDGNKPWQRKARQFIIAAINEDDINPETGFTPEQESGAADWVVNRIKYLSQGGSDEEYRKKFPPPKRGQTSPFVDDEEVEYRLSPQNEKFLQEILYNEKADMPDQMYGVEEFDWEDEKEECSNGKKAYVDKSGSVVYGTDIGPECPKCGETIWAYVVQTLEEENSPIEGATMSEILPQCKSCGYLGRHFDMNGDEIELDLQDIKEEHRNTIEDERGSKRGQLDLDWDIQPWEEEPPEDWDASVWVEFLDQNPTVAQRALEEGVNTRWGDFEAARYIMEPALLTFPPLVCTM